MVTKLCEDVYSVGVVDWDVRNFHGYTTPLGASYNSYLILDEKVTLVDTCKAPFTERLLDNIRELISLDKIDYIICNHVEPDHSGALPAVAAACPRAEILASSPNGGKGLSAYYGDLHVRGVKTGETLCIGKRTLTFVSTPMVHWPDNMVLYDEYDGILFSNDAFGQHIATSQAFDTDNDLPRVLREAKKYYANIVLPYSQQASKAVGAVGGLKFHTIASSHGVIWTKHLPEILQSYADWTSGKKDGSCVIAYASMWHSTEKMAQAIADGFHAVGIKTYLYNADLVHMSDIMTDLMSASYFVVGSPTLNNNLMPSIAALMTYVKGLAPTGLKGFAFGSYGWGGQSIQQTEDMMKAAHVEIVHPLVKSQFVPTAETLAALKRAASEIV